MRKITFITLFPSVIVEYLKLGCLKAAGKKQIVEFDVVDLRRHAVDQHGSVDAKPFGGGDGMVLRPEPLKSALSTLSPPYTVVYPSVRGERWSSPKAKDFSAPERFHYVFVCGRFAGVDERFLQTYVDHEFSIGDYVLAGGELPSMVLVESIVRFLPGVLGNSASPLQDSFEESFSGGLEYPLYTRPRVFENLEVPKVLFSGDHAAVDKWRVEQAQQLTSTRRPDLLKPKTQTSVAD